MDICKAKKFVFHQTWKQEDTIYISKDIQSIIDINPNLIGVFAVIDTESGEKMFTVEYDYSGEPIIMGGIFGCFVHFDYFMKQYPYTKIVYL